MRLSIQPSYFNAAVTASDKNYFNGNEVPTVRLQEVITLFWILVLVFASAYGRCPQVEVWLYSKV